MPKDSLPPFVHFLLDPAAYPHPAQGLRLLQTHISYVFLAGDYVYKFKKPVNFGFLDFSTLEKRKFYCGQELLLNRRLCPDIYLDTVSVNEEKGGLALNGRGPAVEYGVRMARMPEEGMMGRLIERGELTRRHIDAIVATLVPFYVKAEKSGRISGFGRAAAVAVNVLENFEQAKPYIGSKALSREEFDKISGYAREVLANEALFEQRIAEKRICDCHGDLYSANICFDGERVHIFDCIEFNERFRYSDIAADIAFLAMDLDANNLPELSSYFIERFVAASGDAGLLQMLCFYKCYRAAVRGKIGLLTAHEPEVDEQTRKLAEDKAAGYFLLAQRYADQCRTRNQAFMSFLG